MKLVPIPPKILACRQIDAVDTALGRALGLDPARHVSIGLITCDQDDATYVALDEATKHADVDVVYAKSFYAGSAHASGPFSGEVLGVLAGPNPDEVAEGLWVLQEWLQSRVHFVHLEGQASPAFFPHVVSECGRYLSAQAGVDAGTSLAYLIAPPLESVVALDFALKAADVRLVKWFGPPTETNFGGAYLSGDLSNVEAAAAAFAEGVASVVQAPQIALRRPSRQRY